MRVGPVYEAMDGSGGWEREGKGRREMREGKGRREIGRVRGGGK